MKNCPQCGTPNLDDARFCSNCAYSVPVNNTAPPPSKNKGNLKIVLIVLGFLAGSCVLCGLVGGIKEAINPTPKPTSSPIASNSTALIPSPPTNVATPLPQSSPVSNRQPLKSQTPAAPDVKELEVVKAVWREGGFGTVALWTVTIKNNTSKKIGDIKFRTSYSSETGNIVSRGGTDALLGKDTIQKVIPPKSSRTVEVNDGFVSDEAHKANFELVSWRDVP